MNKKERLAPEIRAILESARERENPDKRIEVVARPLAAALEKSRKRGHIPVIAEIKPTSPTTKNVRVEDPVDMAISMVENGAVALSVLTEPDHFHGSIESLERVRDAVNVPILRKDFILDEKQLDAVESDVVLIIASFVDDVKGLVSSAKQRGFQVLVEVHSEEEIEIAVQAEAEIIGINNRNIKNLNVNLDTFAELAPKVPSGIILIAESGIKNEEDARMMHKSGADGLLIGTAIMEGNIEQNTKRFTQIKI
tara:strand:+ start:8938 stop:9696 length:759 start_codon:yes stop_codon:yes gene_type:complete